MVPPAAAAPAPEAYWELTAELPPQSEELWSLFCYERGALGAEWLEEGPAQLTIRFFFDRPLPDAAEWPAAFRARYPGQAAPHRISVSRQAVQAWETAWQAHFAPLSVGERLVICPPWQPEAAAGRVPVIIQPGQGFGTGRHASTSLALELLERHLGTAAPPAGVLDVGAGSGILAIAALRLGAGAAWALDIDGRVFPEIRHNFALNGLAPPRGLVLGRPDCLSGRFALVLANILAPVVQAHAADLAALTDAGGCLIVSGVLEEERAALLARFARAGMAPAGEARREPWYACRLAHRT